MYSPIYLKLAIRFSTLLKTERDDSFLKDNDNEGFVGKIGIFHL